MESSNSTVVSVIIPVYNGGKWIQECIQSIMKQEALIDTHIEICIYDDGSTDDTLQQFALIEQSVNQIQNLTLVLTRGTYPPKGVGFGKNRAVEVSSGDFLCFQDIDDVMMCNRISLQLQLARQNPLALIGSRFIRDPVDSTARFTKWANEMPQDLLTKQVMTSHGPTVIMPTWFCHKQVFTRVGGFSEDGRGTPEDLVFFYKHLDMGGQVIRVDTTLLTYRYHPEATTLSISEETIWQLRIKRLEEKILPNWKSFTIWNAGKQGRKLWKSLSKQNRDKVVAFCDVDPRKIGTEYHPYSPEDRFSKMSIPIRHFRECCRPFVICIKLDMTHGEFEENLASLDLEELTDYVMFS